MGSQSFNYRILFIWLTQVRGISVVFHFVGSGFLELSNQVLNYNW